MTDLTQPLDPDQMKANIDGQLDMFTKEIHDLREQRTAINARLKVLAVQVGKFERLRRAIEGRKRGPAQ